MKTPSSPLVTLLGALCVFAAPWTASALPNPAATYCVDLGYEYEVVDGPSGQTGRCVFDDGTECGGWEFLRGECGQEHTCCELHGGAIEPLSDPSATVPSGLCVTAEGDREEEWAYFDEHCASGCGGCSLVPGPAPWPGLVPVALLLAGACVLRRRGAGE